MNKRCSASPILVPGQTPRGAVVSQLGAELRPSRFKSDLRGGAFNQQFSVAGSARLSAHTDPALR